MTPNNKLDDSALNNKTPSKTNDVKLPPISNQPSINKSKIVELIQEEEEN